MICLGRAGRRREGRRARASPSTPSPPTGWSRKGSRLIEYLQRAASGSTPAKRRERPLGLTDDQMMFAFAAAEGLRQGQDQGPVPRPAGRPQGDPRGVQPAARRGPEGRARGGAARSSGSPISANLIGVFFMKQPARARPGRGRPVGQAARRSSASACSAPGLMGAGIATAHARSGIPTAMVDVDDAAHRRRPRSAPGRRH